MNIPSTRVAMVAIVAVSTMLLPAQLSREAIADAPIIQEPSVVLTEGHADAFQLKLEQGRLVLYFHDDTGSEPRSLDPRDVLMVVVPSARVTLPDSAAFRFLGNPGEGVWIMPQTQEPGILWPGLTTQDLDGQWEGAQIQLRLTAMNAPPGGSFFLYEINVMVEPRHLWRSDNLAASSFTVPLNTHAHMNWAFTQPGMYTLVVEACGRHTGPGAALGQVCSDPTPYTIEVRSG
jgi:surface-anchored protein